MVVDLLSGAAEHPVEVIGGGADLARVNLEIANTGGVFYDMNRTAVAVSLEAIREQSTGYEFDASPFLDEIDARSVGEAAASLAARSCGGSDIETGRYDIILFAHCGRKHPWTGSPPGDSQGGTWKAGRSFLADKTREQGLE